MAIAYYIPDQAKLLAGGRPSRETANNHRNTNNANSGNPQRTSSNAVGGQNPAVNRGYGTTINLTVPTYATSQEPAGCWDFLTQVFCHALRFYHESSQLQPTVIQISVNFQSQAAENTTAPGTTATSGNSTATAAPATATQRNTTPDHTGVGSYPTGTTEASSISATTNSPTAHLNQDGRQPLKVKKSGKRKN